MKKKIYFLLFGVLLMSCSTDSFNDASKNVVNNDGSISFEELLLLINIKTTDSTYLVVKSVDSINIYVNNAYWAKLNSQTIDTSKVDKYSFSNKYLTTQKLNYLVIANQDIKQPNFSTAGDFAQYLNSTYVLKSGEYACFIESFKVTFNDNTTKKYYPFEYKTFKVEQNSRSAYVGEIQIKIN